MLGNISLPLAKKRLQVANAGFSVANGEQDGEPDRVGNFFQNRRDFVGLIQGFHIQNPEYIIGQRKTPFNEQASSKAHDESHDCSASHSLSFFSIPSRTSRNLASLSSSSTLERGGILERPVHPITATGPAGGAVLIGFIVNRDQVFEEHLSQIMSALRHQPRFRSSL
jgi:hypothetical protein